LLELNRTYTRQDIDNISVRVDRDVWKYRGGWYTNPETHVTTPYCRHEWVQQIAIKRPSIETTQPEEPLIEVGTIKIKTIAEGRKLAQQIIEETFGAKAKITLSSKLSKDSFEKRLNQLKKLSDEYDVANDFFDEINLNFNSQGNTLGRVRQLGKRTIEGVKYKIKDINLGHENSQSTIRGERYSVNENGRIIESWSPKVDIENYELGTLTHEFAHVITNNEVANLYSTDANAKQFWTGLKQIRSEYQSELSTMRKNNDIEAINKFYLGQYSATNADEFLAEGFTEYKLNSNPSKYAKKIGELVDKHFKKK
jgi:hypothetical protein